MSFLYLINFILMYLSNILWWTKTKTTSRHKAAFCRPWLQRSSLVNPSQSRLARFCCPLLAWRIRRQFQAEETRFKDCSGGCLGDWFQLAAWIPLKNTNKKEIWRSRESKWLLIWVKYTDSHLNCGKWRHHNRKIVRWIHKCDNTVW